MTLEDEVSGNGLDIVPESCGMDVPSACTIVIITGKIPSLYICRFLIRLPLVRKVP